MTPEVLRLTVDQLEDMILYKDDFPDEEYRRFSQSSRKPRECSLSLENGKTKLENGDLTLNDILPPQTEGDEGSVIITLSFKMISDKEALKGFFEELGGHGLNTDFVTKVRGSSPHGDLSRFFEQNSVKSRHFGVKYETDSLVILCLESLTIGRTLPRSLCSFSKLDYLKLKRCDLRGKIPDSLRQLTRLTRLDLSCNNLTGRIPDSLGQLSNLILLALGNNKLIGEIPSSLGQLSELLSLDLSFNQLTGKIPNSFAQLSKLTFFNLSSNQLSGVTPANFSSLTQLECFYFSGNR